MNSSEKQSNYDLILYDLDGTLINSVPVIMESFRLTYEAVLGGCPRTDEDLMSYIGRPLRETFAMHELEMADRLLETYLEINCRMLEQDAVDLFPGVSEGLEAIRKAGISQGIVTSKRRNSAEITINLKNLRDYMDVFVFFEDTEKHKPDPAPILAAAREAGISDMSRILYVGDALADGLCAVAAGASFALVSWSLMDKEKILSLTGGCEIDTLTQIIGMWPSPTIPDARN